MLIAIEGTDAAGKKTQSKMLVEWLNTKEVDEGLAKLYSFPRYDTVLGQAILKQLQSEAPRTPESHLALQCSMLVDKFDASIDIEVDIFAGNFIVCDRWWQSALAYGTADGLSPAWIARLSATLPKAQLNIFIDVSPEVALVRRPEARDFYERDRAKQELVYSNYHFLWSSMMQSSDRQDWIVVDGKRTVSEVHEEICSAVMRRDRELSSGAPAR